VLENSPVITKLMAVDDAKASGARALFGEKYGDEVRVVSMGIGSGNNMGWSVELCGGTHVMRTGDIGLIAVVSESAVGSGVRRIEALTGDTARHYLETEARGLRDVAALIKAPVQEVPARLESLMEDRKRLERELSEARKELAMGGGGKSGAENLRTIGDVKLLARVVKGIEMKDLKSLADEGKRQVGSGVVAIVGVSADGKAGVVVGVTDDIAKKYDARELVRVASESLGGKGGGGRPDMAQAGGPDGSKAEAALKAVEEAIGSGK
jgi:alanyl-tRNA synthetase